MITTRKVRRTALLLALMPTLGHAVLVTSFETDAELFPTTATNAPITRTTTDGITHGSSAMAMGIASGSWNWSSKNYPGSVYGSWKENKRLLIDMRRVTTSVGGNVEVVIAINGPQGWNQRQLVNWTWQNANAAVSQTLEWDYSALTAGAPAPGDGDYFQISLVARSEYGGQTIYFDNLRFEGDPPPPPPSVAYTFNSNAQGFTVAGWSPEFGGTLAILGNSPGWKARTSKGFGTTPFGLRLAEAASRGGVLMYDLIAPAGTLSGFFVQTVLQHTTGTWNQHDQTLQAASVVPLPGGMELVRVRLETGSAFPNLVATGAYTMHLNWDSNTANTIYLDNVMVVPGGTEVAALTFSEDKQGFVEEGGNSLIWTFNGLLFENQAGWTWAASKNFTASDPDSEAGNVFAALLGASQKGGMLQFKVKDPILVDPESGFQGFDVNLGLGGDPWQQQSPLWVSASSFTVGGDPEAEPPVLPFMTPSGFTRIARVPLHPGNSPRTDGFKLDGSASAYQLFIGSNSNNVAELEFVIDDLEVRVNRDPEIIHVPAFADGTAGPVFGRVLSNGEGVSTYSAAGLPPGVTIDPLTGLVAGTPTANGAYSVSFSVSSGDFTSSSAPVAWTVSGAGEPGSLPMITSFSYDGNQVMITWSGSGTDPVNVLRSVTLEADSWDIISSGNTGSSHTDSNPPGGKAFYKVEVP
jgi:hypothetical protein